MQDAIIGNQTPSAFREVLAGKSSGILRIMIATLRLPLVRNFLFSSVSSVVAPAGQPNYAAANAVLNAAANLQDSQVCFSAISSRVPFSSQQLFQALDMQTLMEMLEEGQCASNSA